MQRRSGPPRPLPRRLQGADRDSDRTRALSARVRQRAVPKPSAPLPSVPGERPPCRSGRWPVLCDGRDGRGLAAAPPQRVRDETAAGEVEPEKSSNGRDKEREEL